MDLLGIDANDFIVEYAKKNCTDTSNISFSSEDILGEKFQKRKFDIAHGSLFFHHLKGGGLHARRKKRNYNYRYFAPVQN